MARDEIGRVKRALVERRFETELDVEFQPAHFAEIVLARIEEHAVEERRGGFKRRRIARTQLAVNFDQGFLGRADGVLLERARDDDADVVALRKGHIHFGDARFGDGGPHFGRERLVRFEQHFAGLAVHQLADSDGAFEIRWPNFRLRDARFAKLLE